MKRLLKQSRVFYELRTIRIAISLVVLISCLVGIVAVFYIRNSTYQYSKDLDSWKAVVHKNDGFFSDQEFLTFKTGDWSARKDEQFLADAHRLATTAQLFKSPVPPTGIQKFIDDCSQIKLETPKSLLLEQESDDYASEMPKVVQQILDYANSLDAKKQLKEKQNAILLASRIAACLDSNYSYSSLVARMEATNAILHDLLIIQSSDLSADVRKSLIEPPIKILNQPLRTTAMFKKEQLRLINNLNIIQGNRKVDRRTLNYQSPPNLSILTVFGRKLPFVADAQESRVYESFADVLNFCRLQRENHWQGTDALILLRFSSRIQNNKASADLLLQLGSNLTSSKNDVGFAMMESNLRKLSRTIAQ